MPEAQSTCSELRARAEAERRRVLNLYASDSERLEHELLRAEQLIEDADNRHDCI